MGASTIFDETFLSNQIKNQKRHQWDLDQDIPWKTGIDLTKFLLPLDEDSLFFPGANAEQRLALSHLIGLIVNSTFAESETVINKLREPAWAQILRNFPINPEMWELGDLFFQEESKHAAAFQRYLELYCEQSEIDRSDLDRLLPKAFGSVFQKAIIANAKAGGHAFWWVVASVEEVSIEIYRQFQGQKEHMDPLFFAIHRRHVEEEARHRNYAFLMLEVIARSNSFSLKRFFHKKADLLFSQFFSTAWVATELHKIFTVSELAHKHPFFKTIHSCLPLLKTLSYWDILKRFLISAPYISLVVNTRNLKNTHETARQQGVFQFPFPAPQSVATYSQTRKY